jgi:adsorption protein B
VQPTVALRYVVACLQAAEHELLLFTAFWFILGALDDFGVDLCWIWLRLTGRGRDARITREAAAAPLSGRAAVLIAAWDEAAVIGHTVTYALGAWKQDQFTLYLGCYGNDPATIEAAAQAAGNDPRIRIVINERPGPTTKADCLNRVYAALCADERRYARRYRSVILHDSEDMVHPAELAVIDRALAEADFVQLPVRPELQPHSPWVAGHYADEFAESHCKALIVRDALGAAIPAAGVGCGFSREMLTRIARRRGGGEAGGPFAAECLTEDYELGLLVRREGGRSRFLRARDENGDLVATRAYFPASVETSVRQKSRWTHGIAFQGWDRLGWRWLGGPLDGAARPSGAADGDRAGLRLHARGGRGAAGTGGLRRHRGAAGGLAGPAPDAAGVLRLPGLAVRLPVRLHRARVRRARRDQRNRPDSSRQLHRHPCRAPGAGGLHR